MSQGALCPNLSQKVQKEESQMANHNLPCVMLSGGLSVNLNHLTKPPVTEARHNAEKHFLLLILFLISHTFGFFILNPKLSDLAILCKFGL